jgi:hypothetical protein
VVFFGITDFLKCDLLQLLNRPGFSGDQVN